MCVRERERESISSDYRDLKHILFHLHIYHFHTVNIWGWKQKRGSEEDISRQKGKVNLQMSPTDTQTQWARVCVCVMWCILKSSRDLSPHSDLCLNAGHTFVLCVADFENTLLNFRKHTRTHRVVCVLITHLLCTHTVTGNWSRTGLLCWPKGFFQGLFGNFFSPWTRPRWKDKSVFRCVQDVCVCGGGGGGLFLYLSKTLCLKPRQNITNENKGLLLNKTVINK